MRLKCAIVSRILAGRTAGDTLPAWVSSHISHCDSCASEAAAYALLRTAIKEAVSTAESPSLTWRQLRCTLPRRSQRVACRIQIPTTVGVAAAIATAIVVGISIRPHNIIKPVQVADQPRPQIERTYHQPAQVVEQPADDSRSPVVPAVGNRRWHRPVPRPLPPPRLQVKRAPAHVNSEPPAMANDRPNVMVDSAPSEAPRYRVVGAEEHVIDVIGATPVSATDTPPTDYVIRHTDTGDQPRAVLL